MHLLHKLYSVYSETHGKAQFQPFFLAGGAMGWGREEKEVEKVREENREGTLLRVHSP